MATRVEAAGATAARTGAARRVAHGGAGQVRPAATPPGLARERHAAPPAATAPAPFVTAPPATVRGRAVPVLVALVRPVPAGTARVRAASATIAPAAVARAAIARVKVVRVKVALGAVARVPAGSVTIAPVAAARAAMARVRAVRGAAAPVKVVRGAAARVLVASVTIARAPAARARVAPAVMARAGIRPGAVPTARPQVPPGRRGLLGVPPTAHPGMATAHAATGLPAVVRSAPIVPPAAARQTDAPLVARPLDARPATGTPGAGDHPAGPRPPQDAQVLSGIARLPGVVQVPAALGAMRARIAVPPRTVASLTAAPPPGPRQSGRAACRRSRPASPWTN
jgi:hypothetical protein